MVQLNLCRTHCVHLSNRTCEVPQRRPPGVAEENGSQRLLLLRCTPFIYIEDNAPRSTRFIVAITSGQHDREIREINGTSVAFEDSPRKGEVAGVVGRTPSFPATLPSARTYGLTVAHFVVRTTDGPGH